MSAASLNLPFVLGNKVMVGTVNAAREHFELGVRDLTLGESQHPGWFAKLVTQVTPRLERFAQAYEALAGTGDIKVVVEVSGATIDAGVGRDAVVAT